jgi:hypothetical protein
MARMEHLINVHASRVARGSIAEFLGFCDVPERHAGSRLLTPGLWLVRERDRERERERERESASRALGRVFCLGARPATTLSRMQ